jgi:hypothetical protein
VDQKKKGVKPIGMTKFKRGRKKPKKSEIRDLETGKAPEAAGRGDDGERKRISGQSGEKIRFIKTEW